MEGQRKTYTEEFKREAIALLEQPMSSALKIAKWRCQAIVYVPGKK